MQISELYRRGIIVPLDTEAWEAVASADVTGNEQIAFLKISDSDDYFYKLWDTGVFHQINAAVGSFIDDYEDSAVEGLPALQQTKGIIEDLLQEHFYDPELREFFAELHALCDTAIESDMPLIFIL